MKEKNKKKSKKTNKKEEKNWKELLTSTKVLWGIWIALVILIVFLSVKIYQKKQEAKNYVHTNLNLPIIKKEDSFEFSIDASALSTTKEYVFRISNYQEDKINKEELTYYIEIENPTDSIIEVYKNEENENLINTQEKTELEDSLGNEEKEDIYYHVRIKSHGKLSTKDFIQIKVTS